MTGQAKSGLGYLFVDIGLGGVGKALKGLNSVSASFLLAKNAAQQAVKPLIGFGKQAADSAVQIGKMSAMFGFTMTEYQKLVRYFKDHKLNEGLLTDLTQLSDKFTLFQQGLSAPTWQQQFAAMQLGLGDLMKYTGSIEDVLTLMSNLQEGIAGMDPNTARMYMQMLNLNPEWIYAFQRGDFNLRDALALSDNEVSNLIDAEEAWARTINDLKTVGQRFIGEVAPTITRILDKSGPLVDKLLRVVEGLPNSKPIQFLAANTEQSLPTKINKAAHNAAIKTIATKTPLGATALLGGLAISQTASMVRSIANGNALQPAALPANSSPIPLPQLPSTAPSSSSVTVNNTNYINSENAYRVVDDLNNITGDSIMAQGRMNKYATNNSGGN